MSIVENFFSDEDFGPSLASGLDQTVISERRLSPNRQMDGLKTVVWKAPPGEYVQPPSATGEVFLIVEGRAKLDVSGIGSFMVGPGSLVTIPPNTEAMMRVETLLRKFVVMRA